MHALPQVDTNTPPLIPHHSCATLVHADDSRYGQHFLLVGNKAGVLCVNSKEKKVVLIRSGVSSTALQHKQQSAQVHQGFMTIPYPLGLLWRNASDTHKQV